MTNGKDANFVNADDPAFLAVKGHFDDKFDAKQYIKQLAQAVFVVYQKHDTAKLRCIGAASLNNAVKAVIIASGEAKKKGFNLATVQSFTTVQFNENEERTAILLEVVRVD